MTSLKIVEHSSPHYAPRTYLNAGCADYTAAFAIDHTTTGERLTQKAANGKIVLIDPFCTDSLMNSRLIYSRLKSNNAKTLNIAGNGLYTFYRNGYYQDDVDTAIWCILEPVFKHWKLDCIYSGGQTGADIAGARAGYRAGIPVVINIPKGYKQRFEDGKDVLQTYEDIYRQVVN